METVDLNRFVHLFFEVAYPTLTDVHWTLSFEGLTLTANDEVGFFTYSFVFRNENNTIQLVKQNGYIAISFSKFITLPPPHTHLRTKLELERDFAFYSMQASTARTHISGYAFQIKKIEQWIKESENFITYCTNNNTISPGIMKP